MSKPLSQKDQAARAMLLLHSKDPISSLHASSVISEKLRDVFDNDPYASAEDVDAAGEAAIQSLGYATDLTSIRKHADDLRDNHAGMWSGQYTLIDSEEDVHSLLISSKNVRLLLNGVDEVVNVPSEGGGFQDRKLVVDNDKVKVQLSFSTTIDDVDLADNKTRIAEIVESFQVRVQGSLVIKERKPETRTVKGKRGVVTPAGVLSDRPDEPPSIWGGEYLLRYTDTEKWEFIDDRMVISVGSDENDLAVTIGSTKATNVAYQNSVIAFRIELKKGVPTQVLARMLGTSRGSRKCHVWFETTGQMRTLTGYAKNKLDPAVLWGRHDLPKRGVDSNLAAPASDELVDFCQTPYDRLFHATDLITSKWGADKEYKQGDRVRPATSNGRVYEATQDGKSGTSEPAFPTRAAATVDDSSVTWKEAGAEKAPHDLFSGDVIDIHAPAWQADTDYQQGDRIKPTTSNGHLYEATKSGTSGSAEPSFPATSGQAAVDNTVEWKEVGSDQVAGYRVDERGSDGNKTGRVAVYSVAAQSPDAYRFPHGVELKAYQQLDRSLVPGDGLEYCTVGILADREYELPGLVETAGYQIRVSLLNYDVLSSNGLDIDLAIDDGKQPNLIRTMEPNQSMCAYDANAGTGPDKSVMDKVKDFTKASILVRGATGETQVASHHFYYFSVLPKANTDVLTAKRTIFKPEGDGYVQDEPPEDVPVPILMHVPIQMDSKDAIELSAENWINAVRGKEYPASFVAGKGVQPFTWRMLNDNRPKGLEWEGMPGADDQTGQEVSQAGLSTFRLKGTVDSGEDPGTTYNPIVRVMSDKKVVMAPVTANPQFQIVEPETEGRLVHEWINTVGVFLAIFGVIASIILPFVMFGKEKKYDRKRDGDLNDKQMELDEIKNEKLDLASDVEDLRNDVYELNKKFKKEKKNRETIETRKEQLKTQRDKYKRERDELRNELDRVSNEVERERVENKIEETESYIEENSYSEHDREVDSEKVDETSELYE